MNDLCKTVKNRLNQIDKRLLMKVGSSDAFVVWNSSYADDLDGNRFDLEYLDDFGWITECDCETDAELWIAEHWQRGGITLFKLVGEQDKPYAVCDSTVTTLTLSQIEAFIDGLPFQQN